MKRTSTPGNRWGPGPAGPGPASRRIPTLLVSLLLLHAVPAQEEKPEKAEAPPFRGKVFGMEVNAASLGIVVDVSESMNRFLPSIRDTLRERAPRNPALHVDGCKIEKPDPRPGIVNGVAPETITAIDALATHSTASTILWITDMGDPSNRDGVISLGELLDRHGVQLLLLSVQHKPSPSIRKVIESSEGYWEVVDLKP